MTTRALAPLSSLALLVATALATAVLACGSDPPAPKTTADAPSAPSSPAMPEAPAAPAASAMPAGSSATATPAAAGDPMVGKPAPGLKMKAQDGKVVDLAAMKGKNVVVYFYPKDETPGCTKEACAFRDSWSDLSKQNVVLVGVSTDTAESHKAFAAHHKLPFQLVSDPDGAVAKAFGVPNNSGFLARQTFVIDKDGNVKKVYRDVDVSKHAAEVLADVR